MGQLCRQFLACEFHINIFGFGGLNLGGRQSALKTALYLKFSKVHYLAILGIIASRSCIPRVISPESVHQCPPRHTQTQKGRGTEIFGNTHSDKFLNRLAPISVSADGELLILKDCCIPTTVSEFYGEQ